MENPAQNDQPSQSSPYICGSKLIFYLINFIIGCGYIQNISSNQNNILCKQCSGRIFYKKRTNKPTQYEAR